MTLIFMESFDDDLWNRGKWGVVIGATRDASGRNGGAAKMTYNWADSNFELRKQVASADEHATFILGFAFKAVGALLSRSGTALGYPVQFLSDSTATNHVGMFVGSSGVITVLRGTTSLGTSGANALQLDTWYYIEIKVTLSDTVGAVTVRVNGTNWINLSSIDTKNAGTKTVFDSIRLTGDDASGTGSYYLYDDLYLCNGAGSIRNDFLGDVAVEVLYPNGDGANSGMTGSDGNSVNNYLLVDETTIDTSDYVGSSVDGTKDTYAFGNLTRAAGTIYGVQAAMHAAKTDAGSRSMRMLARPGSTDQPSSDFALGTGYLPYTYVWQQNPDTSTDWSVTSVNASEFGAEVRP